MLHLILAWALILSGRDHEIVEVDRIELNHYHDSRDGRCIFTQVILWNWYDDIGAFHCVAWRIPHTNLRFPRYSSACRAYIVPWIDRATQRKFTVRAFSYSETYTIFDPELADRKHIPEHARVFP
jgi:hypothetical protein